MPKSQKKSFIRRAGIVVAALLVVSFLVYRLAAQQANKGISVSPSNFELSITPGKTTTQTVRVINYTDNPVTIASDRRNFTARGEEGGVDITSETSNYSLASWISIAPQSDVIPANGYKEFTFSITVPRTAEPGGHFGSLIFKTVNTPKLTQTGAAVSEEVASLILVKIPGETREQAYLESFTTSKNFYEFGPVTFTARVKNQGAVHIKPFGSVVLRNMLGQKTSVQIEERNILPNAVRKIPAVLKDTLLIGKYRATLIMGYGTHNQNLTATVVFWAFPVRYGLIAFAILLVLFIFRKRLFKAIHILVRGK